MTDDLAAGPHDEGTREHTRSATVNPDWRLAEEGEARCDAEFETARRTWKCVKPMGHDGHWNGRGDAWVHDFEGWKQDFADQQAEVARLSALLDEGTRGICGEPAPMLRLPEGAGSQPGPPCELLAGHPGWHRAPQVGTSPMHWSPMLTHRWTTHGHACCPDAPLPESTRPSAIARCGGPAICKTCAVEAAQAHRAGEQGSGT